MAYAKGSAGRKQRKIDKLATRRNKRKTAGKSTKRIQKKINKRVKKQNAPKKTKSPKGLYKTQVGYDAQGNRVTRKVKVKLGGKKKVKMTSTTPKPKTKRLVQKGYNKHVTGKSRKNIQSVTKTKGGGYAVYKKGSKAGKSFNSAYGAAKKKGAKTFTWDGRKYSTK